MSEQLTTINLDVEMLAIPPAEINSDLPKKDWEGFISCWSVVEDKNTACSWAKGDLVSELVATFGDERDSAGESALDKFAKEVGVQLKTVKQYRWVSEAFSSRTDREYGNLSWSHYRAAAGTNDPLYWTKRACDEGWSVAKLVEEIKNASDKASVDEGRPCSCCGSALPEAGSIHVRVDGAKIGSYCTWKCLLEFGLSVYKNEKNQIAVDTPVESVMVMEEAA